jgi:hypothetical protein
MRGRDQAVTVGHRVWMWVGVAGGTCAVAIGLLMIRSDEGGTVRSNVQTAGTMDDVGIRAATDHEGDVREVIIDAVHLPQRGYVVGYTSADGAPGQVVGSSSPLDAGNHQNVRITLGDRPRRTTDMFLVLHREDGQEPGFSYPAGDPPFSDPTGVVALSVTIDPG